jgi:hypothetical protein
MYSRYVRYVYLPLGIGRMPLPYRSILLSASRGAFGMYPPLCRYVLVPFDYRAVLPVRLVKAICVIHLPAMRFSCPPFAASYYHNTVPP